MYEWTDEEGAWRAVAGDASDAEVFEVVPADDPRKRSAASAIGSGRDPKAATARELLRLAEENARIRVENARFAAAVTGHHLDIPDVFGRSTVVDGMTTCN